MFAIPFGRIFWKEYRTNRSLWLVCLLIGVVIQFITWVATIGNPPSFSDRANGLIAAAVLIPMIYAIGCGAIMFASEREDGTSDWLLTLSASPLATLLGKALFAVISTFVSQIVMALSLLIFLGGSKVESWQPVMVPFGVTALIWSGLGSVLSRRVLTSVFAAAFWLFLLTVVLQAIIESLGFIYRDPDDLSNTRWKILWWTNGLITFAVDCWLGWRWCHGKYLDGSVLEKLMSGVNFVSNKLLRRTAEPNRLPLRAEYDQAWRRTWQRLIWQERHRSKLPLALFLIVCVMSGTSIPVWRTGACSLLCVCIWLICGVTPMAMGWIAFQVDSSQQQPRFLANRGISYGSLWLAKQSVWLPRAIFIPSAMSIVAILAICIASEGDRMSILNRVWAESGFPPSNDGQRFGWFFHRAIWFVLLSYACGQLASLLFRRTVIAILVSVFVAYMLGMWYALVDYCRLPLEWPLGLPFLAMMLITLWQMKPWLLEDQSWAHRGKIIASLIAIPVVLVMLLYCERVREVYFAPRIDPNVVEQFDQEVFAQSDWESNSRPGKPVVDRLGKLSRASGDAIPDAARQMMDLINQSNHEEGLLTLADIGIDRLKAIRGILKQRSRQLLDEGHLTDSLNFHLADLRLTRSIGQGGINAWKCGVEFQRSTLEDLVAWANHSTLTVDQLRIAITRIEEELNRYPSFSNAVIKSYVEDRNAWILPSRSELVDRLVEQDSLSKGASQFIVALFVPPSERIRASLLLTRQAELDWMFAATLQNVLAWPEIAVNHARVNDFSPRMNDELHILIATTWLVRHSSFSISDIEKPIKDRLTDIRAALIRLNLIAYRVEHGRLPDRLIQLLPPIKQSSPEIKGATLFDPWSGRLFDYYPMFLFSSRGTDQALYPDNANELALINSQHGPLVTGSESATRINLNNPIGLPSDADSDRRGSVHTIFPIPAPLKSAAEK